ncbi:MAG: acyl-CoA thioesterase [Pseudomonadota bacterium]
MYPIVRLVKEVYLNRKRSALALHETHVCHLRAWPWDIDVFLDLNNGRILTLMDLGRFGFFTRQGILPKMKAKGWYGTVAGTVIRYRRRITVMQKLELRTRVLGWDDRFTYFDQVFWRNGEPCAHAVVRTAITKGKGVVQSREVAEVFGYDPVSPELPEWVKSWDAAERDRPWPPTY